MRTSAEAHETSRDDKVCARRGTSGAGSEAVPFRSTMSSPLKASRTRQHSEGSKIAAQCLRPQAFMVFRVRGCLSKPRSLYSIEEV